MAHGWGAVVGGAGPLHQPSGAQAQGGHCKGHRGQSKSRDLKVPNQVRLHNIYAIYVCTFTFIFT